MYTTGSLIISKTTKDKLAYVARRTGHVPPAPMPGENRPVLMDLLKTKREAPFRCLEERCSIEGSSDSRSTIT